MWKTLFSLIFSENFSLIFVVNMIQIAPQKWKESVGHGEPIVSSLYGAEQVALWAN